MTMGIKGNAEYDRKAICPRDCPNRKIGCHDANTCPSWAEHEKNKAEAYKKRRDGVLGNVPHRPKK